MHIYVSAKMQGGCADASMLFPSFWMEYGWSEANNIVPLTMHPCRIQALADGALAVKIEFVSSR